ncbi:MAG: hypothetical protein U2P59_00140 [Synergistota bacterium]|nr:hypothetical protein [Synergistota bacterium]
MITSFNEMPRKHVLIILFVIASLLFLQFWIMRNVRLKNSEVNTAQFEVNSLERVLKTRSDTVARYKSALRFNRDLLPAPAATATDFYVALVSMLSPTSLQDAVIAKTVEKPDMVTFSVKGEADYFGLLNTVASLRQTSHMMRLSEITTEGLTDGAVRYSFLVEAGIKAPETDKIQIPGGGAQ